MRQTPRLPLHWKILIALALGIAAGLVLNLTWTDETWAGVGVGDKAEFLAHRPLDLNKHATLVGHLTRFAVDATEFVGRLFVQCLRFVAVPIVLFSLIAGTASLGDLRKLGRIGGLTLAFFFCTTIFATVLGLIIANFAAPGKGIDPAVRERLMASGASEAAGRIASVEKVPPLSQQLLDIVPRNPFEAMAQGNMLQVIVFAIVIGIGLTVLPRDRSGPAIAIFETLASVMTLAVDALMRLAPVACFCLICPMVTKLGIDILAALGYYSILVVAGLGFLLFVEYPFLLIVFGRFSPRRFFAGMGAAQLTALSTSSSNATLGVTMECCRKLGVSPQVTSFVCPLGATINMDGTAMYQAMAAMFIAQFWGIDLTFGQQTTILLTATLASVGAPGIPSSGMVLLVGVLASVGVPVQGIAVVLGIDAVLDRFRTVVNVTGDAMTAVIVARMQGEDLKAPATVEA